MSQSIRELLEARDLCGIKNFLQHNDINGDDAETGMPLLHLVIRYGDLNILKFFIQNGANIEIENYARKSSWYDELYQFWSSEDVYQSYHLDDSYPLYRSRPLHLAIIFDKSDMAFFLLKSGADIHKYFVEIDSLVLHKLATPLILAARYGRLDVVLALLNLGAVIDATDWQSETALHHAVRHGHLAVVEALVQAGASINHVCHRYQPLEIACSFHHKNIAEFLLKNGAVTGTSGIDQVFRRPLLVELLTKPGAQPEFVKLLISYGQLFNYIEHKLLFLSLNQDPAITKLLLEEGPDSGKICLVEPLNEAISRRATAHVKVFLEYSYIYDSRPVWGNLFLKAVSVKNNDLNMIKALYPYYDIEKKDSWGRTALLCAISSNNVSIVDWLLEQGANPHARDYINHTALMCAAKNKNLNLIKKLIVIGVDPNILNSNDESALFLLLQNQITLDEGSFLWSHTNITNGQSLLIAAATGGNTEYIEKLLQDNFDVNVQANGDTANQETPLMQAALHGHKKSVALLLNYGADPNVADIFGETALFYAARTAGSDKSDESIKEIIQNLISKGANLEHRNNDGITLLSKKIQAKKIEIAAILIAFGAQYDFLINNQEYAHFLRKCFTKNIEKYLRLFCLNPIIAQTLTFILSNYAGVFIFEKGTYTQFKGIIDTILTLLQYPQLLDGLCLKLRCCAEIIYPLMQVNYFLVWARAMEQPSISESIKILKYIPMLNRVGMSHDIRSITLLLDSDILPKQYTWAKATPVPALQPNESAAHQKKLTEIFDLELGCDLSHDRILGYLKNDAGIFESWVSVYLPDIAQERHCLYKNIFILTQAQNCAEQIKNRERFIIQQTVCALLKKHHLLIKGQNRPTSPLLEPYLDALREYLEKEEVLINSQSTLVKQLYELYSSNQENFRQNYRAIKNSSDHFMQLKDYEQVWGCVHLLQSHKEKLEHAYSTILQAQLQYPENELILETDIYHARQYYQQCLQEMKAAYGMESFEIAQKEGCLDELLKQANEQYKNFDFFEKTFSSLKKSLKSEQNGVLCFSRSINYEAKSNSTSLNLL